MTIYAGETITFKVSATKVDDSRTVLLDTDVTSTEIVIIDSATDLEVVSSTPMTWDSIDKEWRYTWNTTVNGKFSARLRLTGPLFDVWEFQRAVVRTNPSPWTVP